jgi:ATP-dependent helicase/nuclease subunit A
MKTVPQLPTLPFGPRRPEWLEKPAPPPTAALRRVSPSSALAGAEGEAFPARPVARLDQESALALVRGRLTHRLLQSLPEAAPAERPAIGERYLAATVPEWPAADRATLLGQVLAVLQDSAFAEVFAPGSRAEVEVAGVLPLGPGAAVSGRIDRLAVTDARVFIVDYKTNRPAPSRLADAPPAYVLQLALYRELLQRLYPSRTVAAAILWTDTPSLLEIPSSTLDAAVVRMTEL